MSNWYSPRASAATAATNSASVAMLVFSEGSAPLPPAAWEAMYAAMTCRESVLWGAGVTRCERRVLGSSSSRQQAAAAGSNGRQSAVSALRKLQQRDCWRSSSSSSGGSGGSTPSSSSSTSTSRQAGRRCKQGSPRSCPSHRVCDGLLSRPHGCHEPFSCLGIIAREQHGCVAGRDATSGDLVGQQVGSLGPPVLLLRKVQQSNRGSVEAMKCTAPAGA